MGFSHNLLHFLFIISSFLLLCSAARQLPKPKEPLTIQFGPDSPSLLFPQPTFPGNTSLIPNFPFFQSPMLPLPLPPPLPPPPPPGIHLNFPSLPSVPKFPSSPFNTTMPYSSTLTPILPTIPSEMHHNP